MHQRGFVLLTANAGGAVKQSIACTCAGLRGSHTTVEKIHVLQNPCDGSR
jgi:hypothetical protein